VCRSPPSAAPSAGELYLDRCQRVLDEAEQADLAVGALLAVPRGTLRLGVPGPFARAMLAPLLGEFLERFPDLRLHMQLIGPGVAAAHNLDLEIRPGPLDDSGLYMKPLMQVRLGIYASPRYLKRRGIPDSPAALRQHSCIATGCGRHGEPRDSATWRLRRGSELKEVKIDARVAVPDPPIAYQLAIAGVGIALLAQSVMRPDVQRGRLVRILPEWEPEPAQLYALYSARLDSSPKVRAFLQFLQERLGAEIPAHARPKA
jgi:DNA-binding transcriptional LysR family regulator